jgi:hypothetical protein
VARVVSRKIGDKFFPELLVYCVFILDVNSSGGDLTQDYISITFV